MYKITDIREEEVGTMDESNHLSQYLLVNSINVDKETNYRREFYDVYRSTSESVTKLRIDGTDVWCKTEEFNKIAHILPIVNNNKILLWYEAGSLSLDIPNTFRASGRDGYRVHIAYNI